MPVAGTNPHSDASLFVVGIVIFCNRQRLVIWLAVVASQLGMTRSPA